MSDLPRTRAAFEKGVAAGLHSAGQIYVSRRGAVVADLAFGEARPGVPMTPETLMLWMSSSKPVAAVALAQLWERGLLELDDPIARHVSEFGVRGKEGITLRHALTHTGGFRLLNLGWPQASWEEILERVCQMRAEPRWVPGEKAGYHLASSWFVLGEVIRRADGRPFPRYVREEIFEPLGMEDCWIGMPAERHAAYGDRLGCMYNTEGERFRPFPSHRPERVLNPNPGGNGWGPMRQLGRFYEMLLGRGRLGEARVLSPQSVEALTARHRVGLYDHTFKSYLDWGLGFIVNGEHYGQSTVPYGYGGHASRRTFGHSGYRSSTAFADPEHGLAVALVVNGTPEDDVHTRRFRALTEAIYEDLDLAPRAAEETAAK